MPLLNTDLKSTTVEVLGSHIRANDKGKEVLSFVIVVRVVGKEAWQVRGFTDMLRRHGADAICALLAYPQSPNFLCSLYITDREVLL